MPVPICGKCRRSISSEDINVARDVAYCRGCNISYRLSDLTREDEIHANLDLQHPPKGAWYRREGGGTTIGATNRNFANAAGFLVFAVFWNGIVSIFVVVAFSATMHHLHVPLPDWFPAPKMEGGGMMSAGMTAFLWLFLTPFILVGLFVAGSALSSLFGRTEVKIGNSQGTVFTGIGPLGWKRRFENSQIKTVRIHQKRNNEGSDQFIILIETRAGKQIKFGSLLTNERRLFMLAALRKTVLP